MKKPHPTVQATVKLSPELAEKLYEVASNEFGGNISEAVREAIKLLISTREPQKLRRLETLLQLEQPDGKSGTKGTELVLRLLTDPALPNHSRRSQRVRRQ